MATVFNQSKDNFRVTVVRKSSTNEWVAKLYQDGKHVKDADYFGTEKDESIQTARVMLERAWFNHNSFADWNKNPRSRSGVKERRERQKRIKYAQYLLTVGKDLEASGKKSTAADFYALAYALTHNQLPPEMERTYGVIINYVTWLDDTLIPDLREAGQTNTADDLENGISFFIHTNPAFKAPRKSGYAQRIRGGGNVAKVHTQEYTDQRGKHVKYHNTDVVSLNPDGSVTLRSGGYMTRTTQTRMNEVSRQWGLGFTVSGSVDTRRGNYSERKGWTVHVPQGSPIAFQDGMTFNPSTGDQPLDGGQVGLQLLTPVKGPFKRNPSSDARKTFDLYNRRVAEDKNATIHCTVCGEESGGKGTSMFGSVHKYGPTSHKFDPNRQELEHAFLAAGREGANGDTKHPLRSEWLALRALIGEMSASDTFKRNPIIAGIGQARRMINLQEKRGDKWITLAMFRLDQKVLAKQVAKRLHRRHPGKALRLFS